MGFPSGLPTCLEVDVTNLTDDPVDSGPGLTIGAPSDRTEVGDVRPVEPVAPDPITPEVEESPDTEAPDVASKPPLDTGSLEAASAPPPVPPPSVLPV